MLGRHIVECVIVKLACQARAVEGELAAAAAARDAAVLEARRAAEAAAAAAREADALRAGSGVEREQALAALQVRAYLIHKILYTQ